MSDAPGGGTFPPRLPVIRLSRDIQGRLTVTAPQDADPPCAPFPLPPLPLSLHCWLSGLAAEFHRRHRRCMAALLLLDCDERRWVRPLVPAQACGRDGACWTLDAGEAGQPSAGQRVAGSFQTRRAGDLFEAAATVPRLDGLHVVQAAAADDQWSVYTFLHASGETSVVPPDDLMADDWDQALKEAGDRLRFD